MGLKRVILLFCLLFFFIAWNGLSQSAGKVAVYFFWSTGCPHCRDEKAFLDQLAARYPGVEIRSFEVRQNRENAVLFSKIAASYGLEVKGVPATFIGNHGPVIGYVNDKTTGMEIEKAIRSCLETACPDPLRRTEGGSGTTPFTPSLNLPVQSEGLCREDAECPEENKSGGAQGAVNTSQKGGTVIVLPVFGKFDTAKTALPLQTLIIAGLDAFNPCAFFVLFTLLGLLLHVNSRKRLLLVGGIFVFFSGFIYFIFMAAWLNIFLVTGQIAAVTALAGCIALLIAGINIKDFFFFKKGISLVIPDEAKPRLFDRMRKLLKATSFPSVVFGTAVLAIAANTYELFCTVGFPMLYTRILTLQGLSMWQYYGYLVFYNVVYVIPLAFIVLFFAKTLDSKKLSERQGRVLKLVSGMMMLCLGILLLVRPELLNNILVTSSLLLGSLAISGLISVVYGRMFEKRETAG